MNIPPVKVRFNRKDRESILQDIETVLKSGKLTQGEFAHRFEEEFARHINSEYAVTVNSGTSATEIPMRIFGVRGKNVIVPANTFFATPAAVIHAGGEVKYADIEEDTFSLSPESVKGQMDKNTIGIIIVHIGGIITPRIGELQKLCHDKNLFLFEDCAHAHGSRLSGRVAGTFGDAGSFSFFPTKVMTSCEGGMITTYSKETNERARIFRNQGMSWDAGNVNIEMGYNWRMSELHAIVGLRQLGLLDKFIKKRQKIASLYDDGLEKVSGLEPLKMPCGVHSSYYKYIVMLEDCIDRDVLKKTLKEDHSITLASEVYDRPCHLQPILQGKYEKGDFPVAERVCDRHVCLPIYPTMKKDEVDYVVESLKAV